MTSMSNILNYIKLNNYKVEKVDPTTYNVYINTDNDLSEICTFLFYKLHKFVNKVHRKEIFWTTIDNIIFYFILPDKNLT